MPEVNCGITWSILMALRGILHSEYAVGKSPRRIADWAERDVIGIGGSERNNRKASSAA